MVKPPLRTKSIGFKVSEEEYARLETAAQASDEADEEARHLAYVAAAREWQQLGKDIVRLNR